MKTFAAFPNSVQFRFPIVWCHCRQSFKNTVHLQPALPVLIRRPPVPRRFSTFHNSRNPSGTAKRTVERTPVCTRTLFPVYRKSNDTGPASVETRGGEEGTHQEAEDRDKTETARKADRVCRAQKRPPTALSANPRPGGSAPAGKPLKLGRYFICCLCFVSFFLFFYPSCRPVWSTKNSQTGKRDTNTTG